MAEVPPNIFLKPACLGKALAKQGDGKLSAVELCYLRLVAMFGAENRYCKMPVYALAAAPSWHTRPGYLSAPGGTICSVTLSRLGTPCFTGHAGASLL